jgi:hypothetical protein
MSTVQSRELRQVCELLSRLNKSELGEVRTRAGFLGGSEETGSKSTSQVHDWLLAGVEAELHRRLGIKRLPRALVKRHKPDWDRVSSTLMEDLREQLERGGRWRHPWTALGQMAARALADWLVNCGIPVGPRTMLQNIERIWDALEDQYPGYVRAGLLHCALDPRLVGA